MNDMVLDRGKIVLGRLQTTEVCADQPALLRSLIRAVVIRLLKIHI